MANKWISKIGRKPAFLFWLALTISTLLCAILWDAWWHYLSAVFCGILAALCWNDEVIIDDEK